MSLNNPITIGPYDLNDWHPDDAAPIRDWLRLHQPPGFGIFGFTVYAPDHIELVCAELGRSGRPYIVGGQRVELTRAVTRPVEPFPMDALPRSLVDPDSFAGDYPPL